MSDFEPRDPFAFDPQRDILKYPPGSRNRVVSLQFANGLHGIALKTRTHFSSSVEVPIEHLYVRAKKRIEHGDSKTQSVRKEFMGMHAGQCGEVAAVWNNLYGTYLTVLHNDGKRTTDCRASELEKISKEEFEFSERLTLGEFQYETDQEDIPRFSYDRELLKDDLIHIMYALNKVRVFRVLSREHIMGMVDGKVKALSIRLTLVERTE
jgi:hypothetical protein